LNRKEFADIGWGLTMAWGMGCILAISGFLMLLRLATAPVLTGLLLIGFVTAASFVAKVFTDRSETNSGKSKAAKKKQVVAAGKDGWRIAGLTVLWVLAALAFASSVAWPHHIDPNDDLICYLMLPVKLLATGTLIEPFSFQRAGTFGGQSILQSLVMIVGAERNGHVPDRGIAMLAIFGMLLHATRGLQGRYAFANFLLLLAFWIVPVPRISTNGAMTGGALLLGMLITLETVERTFSEKSRSWRLFLPVGILLAGTCSIRPTFTVVALFVLAALALRDFWNGWRTKTGMGSAFFAYCVIGVTALAILLPFMAVLYQSNGTPMVPPFSGYVSKAYQTYAFNEPGKDLAAVLHFFSTSQALSMLALLLLPAFLPPRFFTVPIVVGTFLASVVVLHRFSALAFLDMYRYLYPIYVPISVWLLGMNLRSAAVEKSQPTRNWVGHVPLAGATLAALVFIGVNLKQGWIELREQAMNLPLQMREVKPFFDPRLRRAYAHLQDLVPPGEKILTMVDASYWFDFRRNPIVSINAVGGSSPPPGIPFGQGPQALANYLKSLGYRYVIAVDFNNAVLLYTRRLWNEATRPEWFYTALWKPRFNDFMDNIDALAARDGALLARAGNARLIDLGP
jgi:hypothetical protein